MNAICCALNLLFFVPKSPQLTNAKPTAIFAQKWTNLSGVGHYVPRTKVLRVSRVINPAKP
jgi:histidinol dehydrogenase